MVRDRSWRAAQLTVPTALRAHSCSSTKQTKREPTHATRLAFTTSHSWLRAEQSSERHTSGRVNATPPSWTSRASFRSTGQTVSRPTGSTLMGSSSRRSVTRPKRAREVERSASRPRSRCPRGDLLDRVTVAPLTSPSRRGRRFKRRSSASRQVAACFGTPASYPQILAVLDGSEPSVEQTASRSRSLRRGVLWHEGEEHGPRRTD